MSLTELRLNRGMNVAAVARLVGVPAATVYYWEREGARPRDAEVAKRVADLFGVRVTDIWPISPSEASPAPEPKAAA